MFCGTPLASCRICALCATRKRSKTNVRYIGNRIVHKLRVGSVSAFTMFSSRKSNLSRRLVEEPGLAAVTCRQQDASVVRCSTLCRPAQGLASCDIRQPVSGNVRVLLDVVRLRCETMPSASHNGAPRSLERDRVQPDCGGALIYIYHCILPHRRFWQMHLPIGGRIPGWQIWGRRQVYRVHQRRHHVGNAHRMTRLACLLCNGRQLCDATCHCV
jgi:hypothetical protein